MNGDIKDLYQETKWALILRGILALLVGVAILWRPMASVAALAMVIVFWSLCVLFFTTSPGEAFARSTKHRLPAP